MNNNTMAPSIVFHPKLSECKQCKAFDYDVSIHPLYNECHILQCCQCMSQWFVCRTHNTRFNHQNLAKLRKHFTDKHISTPLSNPNDNSDNENIPFVQSFPCNIDDDDESVQHLPKKFKTYETRDTNQPTFFDRSISQTSDDTIKKIIGTAFSNNCICPSNISQDEVSLHLNITNFSTKLSESQQYQFTDILNQLHATKFVHSRPPTSFQDLQKFYLSGKYSIYKNIACPSVSEFDDHACILLQEVVQFALATLDNLSIKHFGQTTSKSTTHAKIVTQHGSKP